ncbi:hypothetical protein BASA81_008061 [Batrachochytrium salamandrivorans]|nr:hypothetical protein BASA81_008061 [Batrachochytrium salamandrivorans]
MMRKTPSGRMMLGWFALVGLMGLAYHLSFSPRLSFSPADKEIVFVLGMHHSMTSVATKLLLDTGLFYGGKPSELLLRKDNALKYWELKKCVTANQALFKAQENVAGRRGVYSWLGYGVSLADRASNDRLRANAKHALQELLQASEAATAGKQRLLVKDPRLSLTIRIWLEQASQLGMQAQCLVLVRDPMETTYRFVADYQVLSAKEWAHVWEQYMFQSLKSCLLAGVPVHVVHHEDYGANPVQTTMQVVEMLTGATLRKALDFPYPDWAQQHVQKHRQWQAIKPHLLLLESELLSDEGRDLYNALQVKDMVKVNELALMWKPVWLSLHSSKLHAAYSCKISPALVNAKVLIRSILQFDASKPFYAYGPYALQFKYELRRFGWIVCTDGELSCVKEDDEDTELHELDGDSFALAHDHEDNDETAFMFEKCPAGKCASSSVFTALSLLGGRVSEETRHWCTYPFARCSRSSKSTN